MSQVSPIEIKQISAEEQEEIIKKKLEERAKYQALTEVENPRENQLLLLNLCKGNTPQEGFLFWCNNFVWIQDPEAEDITQKEIPFILWNYQEEAAKAIIDAIEGGYDMPIEKSRKMGLSWLVMSIFIYLWHFYKYDFLCGSQTKAKVDRRGDMDSLFEKARFIIERLPNWMIPPLKEKEHDKGLLLIHPVHGATIAGESNNQNFGRAGRRRAILFDEFSSWELTDKAAWQSCAATTKCRIALSTPNLRGTNCHYYEVVRNAKKKELPYIRLHWTLNPIFAKGLYYDDLGKPRSPWYDEQCRRATSLLEVAQELDIDYEASMGDKVFGDFKRSEQVIDGLKYDESLPLYVAIDFGLDATAILWIQPDREHGTINIIDEYQNTGSGEGTSIYHYIDIIESKPYKQPICYGDPYSGESRNLTSGSSNARILRRYGYIFKSKRTKISNRIAAGRNILDKVRVSDKCILTIEMFSSWQFKKTHTGTSQIPEHNEYSHIGDAYCYFAWNYGLDINSLNKAIPKKQYKPTLSGVVL